MPVLNTDLCLPLPGAAGDALSHRNLAFAHEPDGSGIAYSKTPHCIIPGDRVPDLLRGSWLMGRKPDNRHRRINGTLAPSMRATHKCWRYKRPGVNCPFALRLGYRSDQSVVSVAHSKAGGEAADHNEACLGQGPPSLPETV